MSTKLPLTLACGDYEITRPLADGSVTADGIALTVLTRMGSRERHTRLARHGEFDVCEFNASTWMMMAERGGPLAALPVFLHRRFRHGFAFVNTGAGIRTPADLVGRRIGVGSLQATGNVWVSGILDEFHGMAPDAVTWVVDREEDLPFTPRAGMKIERISADRPLDGMLAEGEIDALISPAFPRPFLKRDPRVARLFPDFKDRERAYFRDTGIFPIMHATTIRREIVERHPWVPGSLMRAFDEAKRLAYERVRNPRVVPLAWFASAWEEQAETLGDDPWEYGLGAANRTNLETLARYVHRQGLTSRLMTPDELFLDCGDDARSDPTRY